MDSTMDEPCTTYTIMSLIGRGAYGRVYKAREDAGERRVVAVKRLNFGRPEEGVHTLMIREVSLLRRLEHFEHPNIVK